PALLKNSRQFFSLSYIQANKQPNEVIGSVFFFRVLFQQLFKTCH
ncbi:unnamed protein product, partial [Gulo gulo]